MPLPVGKVELLWAEDHASAPRGFQNRVDGAVLVPQLGSGIAVAYAHRAFNYAVFGY